MARWEDKADDLIEFRKKIAKADKALSQDIDSLGVLNGLFPPDLPPDTIPPEPGNRIPTTSETVHHELNREKVEGVDGKTDRKSSPQEGRSDKGDRRTPGKA